MEGSLRRRVAELVAALKLEEREEISRGIAAGRSVRRIAREYQTIAINDKPRKFDVTAVHRLTVQTGPRKEAPGSGRCTPLSLVAWRSMGSCTMARWRRSLRCNRHPSRSPGWLEEAAVPDRPRHADILRSDPSPVSFVQTRGVLKKELTAQLRTRRQIRHAKGGKAPIRTGAHTRYGLLPRADPPRPRIAQFLAIGKEIFLPEQATRTS